MKFGGTSVGDASCIARTAQICATAAREDSVVVVVSAMSGVTNRLIEAATFSEAGEGEKSSEQLAAIRRQHEIALDALIANAATRKKLAQRISGSKLVMIPQASHIFSTDQPDAAHKPVLEFLSAQTTHSASGAA